jgi:hypothetical protein
MKIALIAPSGVGKTAFLSGLHGVLRDRLNKQSGYGITYEVTKQPESSVLDDRYTQLIEHDNFGQPSKDITTYPVKLTTQAVNGEKKHLFLEIIDFPGEALHKATEESQGQVKKIISELSKCDGFIVLLDGGVMIKSADKENSAILQNRIKADDIRKVLEEALERRRQRLGEEKVEPDAYAFSHGITPIVFALTKGDLVEDWLAQAEAEKVSKLDETVKDIFNLIGETPRPGERYIASLIRSQFGKILDMPDVASLRKTVTVYNQRKKKFDPRGLEHLLQYVVFTGLHNAGVEYESRIGPWKEDLKEKDKKLADERAAYERAVSASKSYSKQGWLDKLAKIADDAIEYGEIRNQSFHDQRCRLWHADMERAAKANEESLLSLKKVQDNLNTAHLFQRRILSDELVYLLDQGTPPQSFYQAGLPIDRLRKLEWWQEKSARGAALCKKVPLQTLVSPGVS